MLPLLPVIRAWLLHLYHALLPAARCPATGCCPVIACRERAVGPQASAIFFVQLFALYARTTPHLYFCATLVGLAYLAAGEKRERNLIILWPIKLLQPTAAFLVFAGLGIFAALRLGRSLAPRRLLLSLGA